jgi:Ca2+-transporting ATPase
MRYGSNVLEGKRKRPVLLVFLGEFKDFMTLILGIAAVISGIVGDLTDSLIILGIALINGIIGFVQEYRADRALEELKQLGEPRTTVVRDGELRSVAVGELAPGDVVMLETGTIVPADMRLCESYSLRTQEASLTGESQPVDKRVEAMEADVTIGDRVNIWCTRELSLSMEGERAS